MSNIADSIGWRYLTARRGEAFITIISIISILGVAIGVMVLNMVMGIMTGFETELKSKILGANAHITIKSGFGSIEDSRDLMAKISKIDGVNSVDPYTYHQAMLRTEEKASGLLIRGVQPGGGGSNIVSNDLVEGEGFRSTSMKKDEDVILPKIVVGRELARTFHLKLGDTVSLLSPSMSSTPFGLVPKYKRFSVSGIYSSGLIEYESSIAYVELSEAQKFFRQGESVTGVEIRVKDADNIQGILDQVKSIINSSEYSQSNLLAQDWTEINKPLWEALRLEKRVYFLVLTLLIIMASFSIVSTLIMIVLEKRKDIAVLRTIGASESMIKRIFLFQGAVIGGIGTILGLILAVIGCVLLKTYGFPLDERIFNMSTVPVVIQPINFIVVGICSFLICCLATLYPAKRASSISPVEALR